MLQAELKGKAPELENLEDILTSNIFGLLKYLPFKEGIFHILKETKDYTENRNSLFGNNKTLAKYKEVEFLFWENSQKFGEPDLILIFKRPNRKLKDLMLCIEVKYTSPKSRSGELDQLKDYCLSLEYKKNRKTYYNPEIAKFEGNFLGLVYLTYFSQYRSVRESLLQIKKQSDLDYESKLYELRWNDITESLGKINSKSLYINKIIKDLLSLLKKKNFIDFNGFTEVDFNQEYKSFLKIDLKTKRIKSPKFMGFSNFEDPGIFEYSKYIFLEVER